MPIDPNARPLPAADLEAWRKWRAALHKGRRSMEKLQAAGAAMAWIEEWRRTHAPSAAPVFDQAAADRITKIFGRWNRLEEIFSGTELERFGVRLDGGDLMVYASPWDREPGPGVDAQGLGMVWFVVAGVVLLIGAIVTTEAIDYAAQKEEGRHREALRALDAQMAAAPPDVRAAYERMKKEDPVKKELSLWDRIGGFFQDAGALAVLAIVAFFVLRSKGSSSTTRPAEQPAPIIIKNPCGGGYVSAPRGAKPKPSPGGMVWSRDPAARNRQASYVSAWYYGSPDEKEWVRTRRQKGGGGWRTVDEYQDEVPF